MVTSESVESDPEDSPAPVRVRVADDQMLPIVPFKVETRCNPILPAVFKVEVAMFQTDNGILVIDAANCETIEDEAMSV